MKAETASLRSKSGTKKVQILPEKDMSGDHCNISFYPKRMSSDSFVWDDRSHQRSVWGCFRKEDILSKEMIDTYMTRIFQLCLTHRVDSYRIHSDRLKGAKLIIKVARQTNYNDLTITQVVGIIWSSMSSVHHFYIRLLPRDSTYKSWNRRRQYNYGLLAYRKVLLMLLPAMFITVVQSIVTFFNESKTWHLEHFVTLLLVNLLEVYKDNEKVAINLLDIVETTESQLDARNVLKVLQRLLLYIEWEEIEESLIVRLLKQFKKSVVNVELIHLRSGYEACIRHALKMMKRADVIKAINIMLEWVSTMDATGVIEFANLLEHAAKLHNDTDSYYTSITQETLKLALELVASDQSYISILGNRVFYYLLENEDNKVTLLTPKFFFQDIKTDLNIGKYKLDNKRFLQENHMIIHDSLMTSIYKHGNHLVNLECIFANVAVMVVEVPCGYTAAASVCLVMAMQEYALDDANLRIDNFYRVHACVMFIMSLVCHVHKAKIFYDYVNSVLSRRAQLAPQLNPPLCLTYRDYSNDIKRTELYFEDWEARYGLWKCFIRTSTD